ncbi:MAG: hypothetical protein ACI8X3_001850 [Saprospiraceae bacterium]|jgi:hypothetical protein
MKLNYQKLSSLLILSFLILACQSLSEIEKYGQHYQKNNDYQSLHKVVELMPLDSDSTYVRKILGEPIDMGFDFRYLIDSTGPKGCVVGAVFHINEEGKIDQKWLDEICE